MLYIVSISILYYCHCNHKFATCESINVPLGRLKGLLLRLVVMRAGFIVDMISLPKVDLSSINVPKVAASLL
jgi:hypothetical protein